MGVQWRTPSRPAPRLRFLTIPPRRLVIIYDQPAAYACLALHFPDNASQSVPCLGDECGFHHWPLKVHAYTVGYAYVNSEAGWVPYIIDLGHASTSLACTDVAGRPIILGREDERNRRSNLIGHFADRCTQAPPAADQITPIDVRPFLMRRYGLYEEADYFACREHTEQPRLKFDAQDAPGQAS